MDDYPDPDDEFELMYGDELELLNEQREDSAPPPPVIKCKKSLNFNDPQGPSTSKATSSNIDSFNAAANVRPESQELLNESLTAVDRNIPLINSQSLANNKRTIEDLFGDISDLSDAYFDVTLPDPKRQKQNEYKENLALIQRIIELRNISKQRFNASKPESETLNVERDMHNLSYNVPRYPFVKVTRSDQESVYVRCHSEEYEKEEMQRIVKECTVTGVIGEEFKDVWKEAERLINLKLNQQPGDNMETEIPQQTTASKLWVDLYKPRRYLELLSDEGTNRVLLRWIKLWDKVVFNKRPKMKSNKGQEKPPSKFFKAAELDTTLDEDNRPKHKVALLCGPPGLGKTTLAHTVARHAGYNVVEINASDDRSTEAFRTAIENATQMRSIVDKENRPNCLIFDEIDGAPSASIDLLVKFVSGTASLKKKKGKKKSKVLKRPIICICNDVYVPSLRSLRQVAFVINFPHISSVRLGERLMEIAGKEQINTDLMAMTALAEKSGNDIRSCLSMLHFYKSRGRNVTLNDVYNSDIGQKDLEKGIFDVWQTIFHIPTPKPNRKPSGKSEMAMRMARVIECVSSFGDYDKIAQGVFENYPTLIVKDSSLGSICQCLDWFVTNDLISKYVHTLQNYSLSAYLQYAFVVWHFQLASNLNQKLVYPKMGFLAKQKEDQQKATVLEVMRGLKPHIRVFYHRTSLILDVLPLIVVIITPEFRPVTLHLFTKEEKANIGAVVNVMIDYNLNYVQERLPDGTMTYTLDPNIEEIVSLDKTAKSPKGLSYTMKLLFAREIELEKVRRLEAPKRDSTIPNPVATPKPTTAEGEKAASLPNHLQKLQVKSVAVKDVAAPSKDFFGRIVNKVSPKGNANSVQQTNDVWYQYKEGYSNAVRRKILIGSLK